MSPGGGPRHQVVVHVTSWWSTSPVGGPRHQLVVHVTGWWSTSPVGGPRHQLVVLVTRWWSTLLPHALWCTLCSNSRREEAVVRWFHWLIANQKSYGQCGGEESYGEMLLLAAIHFQEKRRGQIMEMVSGTLGFSLQVSGRS